jgi:hypothetical protein
LRPRHFSIVAASAGTTLVRGPSDDPIRPGWRCRRLA